MGEPARQLPEEDRADIRPDIPGLRALEGGGEGNGVPRGKLQSVSDDDQQNEDQQSDSSADDGDGDNDGADAPEERSLYNADRDNKPTTLNKFTGNLRKFAGNKLLVGGAAVGGGGTAILVISAILLFGSLKIPNLMAHITGYQFARVTRQMAESSSRVTEAKIVVDSADEGAYNKFKTKYYSNPAGRVGQQWSKLDKYRPQKMISNFDKSNTFKLNYKETNWGKQQLVGVTLENNRTILVQRPTGLTRFSPGAKFLNDISYSSKIAPVLKTSLKANDVGFLVRGSVAKGIRQRAGISLVAWKVGQFKGKTAEQARLEQTRTLNSAVTDGKVQPSSSQVLKGAGEAAQEVERANIADDKKLPAILANSGVDKEAVATIEKSLQPSGLATVTGFVNPIYGLAVPLCIIYDGSLTESGPTINAQTVAQKKTYYYVAVAADQQKNGYDAEPAAVGALNNQLGDTSTSIVERRAVGNTVNTSNEISTQASAGGDFSILDVILPGPISNVVGNGFGKACPVLTDLKTGAVLAALNIALVAGSAGTAGVAESSADVATTAFIKTFVSKLVSNFTSRAALRATGGKATVLFKDTALSVGKTAGATLLAKFIVLSKMNSLNNGLQSNDDLVQAVDSGGNMAAGDLEQQQFFGAPLGKNAVIADAVSNQIWLNDQQKDNSLSNRYIAISNPNSLINRLAISIHGKASGSGIKSMPKAFSSILSSINTLPTMLFSSVSGKGHAAQNISNANTYYGNVQFGYTPQELALLKNDPSYSYLDNQKILDDSGMEKEIALKYAKCFGYNADSEGTLSPGGPQIGDLLADESIKRNEAGDVLDGKDILCSETNLSFNNPDYNDLVFRWRVAHSDSNTIDQLTDGQEITADEPLGGSTATAPTTTAPAEVSGDSIALAKGILSNNNIDLTGYSVSVKQDIEAAAQGKPGTAGAMTSNAILKVIAAVGKDHKVLITAIQSNGQGHSRSSRHYVGDAVDFGSLDGIKATGRDSGSIKIADIIFANLKQGGFGQVSCSGANLNLSVGFTEFDDTCNHLHFEVTRGTP